MSVAFHITAEADDFDEAFARLSHIVSFMSTLLPVVRDQIRREGISHPVDVGGIRIGAFSIEDDEHMGGRMRLRRIGQPQPAFKQPDVQEQYYGGTVERFE